MYRAVLITTSLVAAATLMAAFGGAAVITKVTVRNEKFEQTRTPASPRELERFNLLFAKKKKAKPPEGLKWTNKLDIEQGRRRKSTRWLYHPDGWLVVLSKALTPVYMLESPDEFRKLVLE